MPGRHVGNATMVPSRTNWCASSLRYALISGELGSNLRLVCMVSPSAPHPNGNVRVFPLPVGRHRDFEDTGGLISNVTEEEIAVVVHSASRNIVRQARGMFESSDFLSLDRLGIEAPYHALILFPRFPDGQARGRDRKSTRLNSSHTVISYAVFCLKKKKYTTTVYSYSGLGSSLRIRKSRPTECQTAYNLLRWRVIAGLHRHLCESVCQRCPTARVC